MGALTAWPMSPQAPPVRRLAPAVEWRTPTSILIVAFDYLPDGDANVLAVLACVRLRGQRYLEIDSFDGVVCATVLV